MSRRLTLLLIFAALFFSGLTILAIAELQNARMERDWDLHPQNNTKKDDLQVVVVHVLEHLASALIVASAMGVSYEYIIHKHVIDEFEDLLKKQRQSIETTFDTFRTTSARDVFSLIGNIAGHSNRIPTLFDPPREATTEFVFATDKKFFERLIGGEKSRDEAIEALTPWLVSPSIQLRFLASDFVGMLRLTQLAPRLRELAAERQKEWKSLSDQEKSCILNFWWAASCCEEPPYQLLKTRVLEWEEPFVQKWILFVARQMPDAHFAQLVKLFLRIRGQHAHRDVMEAAIAAVEALHHTGFDMRPTVRRHRTAFEASKLWDEASAAVSAVPANAQPRRWFTGVRRLFAR